jgi:TipAS antibiotic-recognition domain
MIDRQLDLADQEKCRIALQEEQTKSLAETNNWAHVDRAKVHADWDVLYKELAKSIDTSSPDDEAVQSIVAQHYQIACRFYMPSPDAYVRMALFYNEDSDMKDFHNAYHPKMVDFLGAAINIFVQGNISENC